jgi:hypothetical protein
VPGNKEVEPATVVMSRQKPRGLTFEPNERIGRFELIREIARGGMGQVFLARDTTLGRKVAIKFLLHDDPAFVQRFVVEARATARCTHENIVTIYDVSEYQGLPYMVLEFLEGKTLSDVLEGKPALRAFCELMLPVARALERAHEHGIVHRDLKPSNVFVTERGQVKVLDFGVARLLDPAERQLERASTHVDALETREDTGPSGKFTASNSLVGTLPYMSPEQWGAGEVDALSDVWAFGIMFWRAIAGVHPAGSTSPEKLKARMLDLATPLPSIASRDASLAPELIAMVDRCLRKPKRERYQSAAELAQDLQAFLAPTAVREGEGASPYRGLAAFGEEDAKFFFGRSNEIRTAVAQLAAWPLLAVVGPSGVGKSSFVHAGLVPAVRATGGAWHVRVLRPGRAPIDRLAGVLEESLATGENAAQLGAQLADAPGLFGARLREAAAKRGERVLIVVDQLEELFTLCNSDDQRRTFLAALLAAADDPSSPVRVVLSMRADFLDRLADHKQFLAELSRGLCFLSTPDRENLHETLARPAELAGYRFEDPAIIDDMMQAATSRGALPLLQFAAMRLWDARDKKRKLLTTAAYDQMGGVGGAFARHAEEVASAIPPQNQTLLRAILMRLVTPEGTRAVVDLAELSSLGKDVELVVDHLVRARLIHLQSDPSQGTTVELVHEMLITEWPQLVRWLEAGHALRGFLHELRQAARQWAARGKPTDLVWRGATAQEAVAIASRNVLDLSATEQEFMTAVRRLQKRGRRRRVAVVTSIICALSLVIAGGAVAVVRISAAERDARDKADEIQRQLDVVRAAQLQKEAADKKSAEAAAAQADADRRAEAAAKQTEAAAQLTAKAESEVQLSREELQQRNTELKRTLGEAQVEKQKAQAAAEVARKATDDAKAANTRLQALLDQEKERVKTLEREKQKIYSGGLH